MGVATDIQEETEEVTIESVIGDVRKCLRDKHYVEPKTEDSFLDFIFDHTNIPRTILSGFLNEKINTVSESHSHIIENFYRALDGMRFRPPLRYFNTLEGYEPPPKKTIPEPKKRIYRRRSVPKKTIPKPTHQKTIDSVTEEFLSSREITPEEAQLEEPVHPKEKEIISTEEYNVNIIRPTIKGSVSQKVQRLLTIQEIIEKSIKYLKEHELVPQSPTSFVSFIAHGINLEQRIIQRWIDGETTYSTEYAVSLMKGFYNNLKEGALVLQYFRLIGEEPRPTTKKPSAPRKKPGPKKRRVTKIVPKPSPIPTEELSLYNMKSTYHIGDEFNHKAVFGRCLVLDIEGNHMEVRTESDGIKMLVRNYKK